MKFVERERKIITDSISFWKDVYLIKSNVFLKFEEYSILITIYCIAKN